MPLSRAVGFSFGIYCAPLCAPHPQQRLPDNMPRSGVRDSRRNQRIDLGGFGDLGSMTEMEIGCEFETFGLSPVVRAQNPQPTL